MSKYMFRPRSRIVWCQLRREGFDVARCTVERLMKEMGIVGAIRGRTVKTSVPDKAQPCPLDKVHRLFQPPAPNRLWVSNFNLCRDLARLRLCGFRH